MTCHKPCHRHKTVPTSVTTEKNSPSPLVTARIFRISGQLKSRRTLHSKPSRKNAVVTFEEQTGRWRPPFGYETGFRRNVFPSEVGADLPTRHHVFDLCGDPECTTKGAKDPDVERRLKASRLNAHRGQVTAGRVSDDVCSCSSSDTIDWQPYRRIVSLVAQFRSQTDRCTAATQGSRSY